MTIKEVPPPKEDPGRHDSFTTGGGNSDSKGPVFRTRRDKPPIFKSRRVPKPSAEELQP